MKPYQECIIHKAIDTFGKKNQTMQTIEELMELQKALFENVHRGTNNVENIIEEVADVEIMLDQIKEIYNIDPNIIEQTKEYKLRRLNHTISKYLDKNPKPIKITSQAPCIQVNRDISNER